MAFPKQSMVRGAVLALGVLVSGAGLSACLVINERDRSREDSGIEDAAHADAGPTDAPLADHLADDLSGHFFCMYHGNVQAIGSTFEAGDGCNTCECTQEAVVSCSHDLCVDGGRGDAAGACFFEGQWHVNGDYWTMNDGCNGCQCMNGQAACTACACFDGGNPFEDAAALEEGGVREDARMALKCGMQVR